MRWWTQVCQVIGLYLFVSIDFANAAVGNNCAVGGNADCNAGNNEVCDTGNTELCVCDAGYVNEGGFCNIDCGAAPSAPANGQSGGTTGTTEGNTITYTCNAGYTVTGSASIACQADGTWETAPTCTPVDCGAVPAAPANGAVGTPSPGTTFGSTVTYTCDAGYTGSASISCQADGTWEAVPTCTIVDCGLPPSLTDGSNPGGATTFGSAITYTCNTGYNLAGGATIQCQAAGTWEALTATCTIVDCGAVPGAPSNGQAGSNTGTTYQSTATYTCDAGYTLTGSATITCQSDGTWETAPTCTIVDCGAIPAAPLNGAAGTPTPGTTYQSTVTYTCDTGYTVTGSATIVCQAGGTWETAPTCTIDDCGSAPAAPANGAFGSSTGTIYLSTATYTCDTGYTLSASGTITCQAGGAWETLPTCVIDDCGSAPAAPANGAFGSSTGTTFLSTATYTCDTGYTLTGLATITCQSGGTWESVPTCIIVDCGGAPGAPTNGQAGSNIGTTYQSTATYTCDTGYTLTGSATITCQADGTWETAPTCTIVDCLSVPVAPANGQAGSNTGTTYLSTATYTCDAGYTLTGSATITCQADGTWETAPTCTIVDCGGAPGAPTNGQAGSNTGTTYQSTATYTCDTGYTLTGSATITCQADGTWETAPTCTIVDCGAAPGAPSNGQAGSNTAATYLSTATYTCDAGYTLTGLATITCQADGTWEAAPTCVIVDCGAIPAAPTDGAAGAPTSGTTYQSTVTYTCNTGYTMTGSATITCQADGTWEAAPTCVIVDCGPAPSLTDGLRSDAGPNTYGTTASYSCNTGYDISGTSTIQCQAGGTWEALTATCTIKDCGAIPTLNDGATTDTTTTFGSQVTYSCNTGYTFSGDPDILCQADGTWEPVGAVCTIVDCGTPPSLTDGLSTGTTTYLSTVIYTCSPGYTIGGDTDIVCQADGSWQTLSATCTIKDCGAVPFLANGARSDAGGTTYNSRATFACDIGYTISGDFDILCQADGTWESVTATCNINDCGNEPALANGARNDNGPNTFGTTATYICNVGYDIGGDAAILCQANGVWETLTATCTIKDCGAVPSLTNGARSDGGTTKYGALATYQCNVGYQIGGDVDVLCQSDGTWETLSATCTIKVCPAVTAPANGAVDQTGGITHGSTVTYSCDIGYTLNGAATVECVDGSWATADPTCDFNTCPITPVTPTDGSFSLVESTGTFTCDSGFVLIGTATTICLADGTWSSTEPTCQLACTALSDPQNGGVTMAGATATFSCDLGFALSHSTPLVCQTNGAWVPSTEPECNLVCPAKTAPTNGAVTMSGANAIFSCNPGYILVGSSTITCQASGSWTEASPTCSFACTAQTAPADGAVSTTGDTAEFTCNSGFVLTGSALLVCSSGTRTWDGTAPTCVFACTEQTDPTYGQVSRTGDTATFSCDTGFRLDTDPVNTMVCQTDGSWVPSTAPDCVLACSAQTDPANGAVTMAANVATFSCITGFVLNGVAVSTCTSAGAWTSATPTCDLECLAITAPHYGTMSVSGAVHSFTCPTGFTLNGASSITCLAGGSWSGTVPSCDPSTTYNGICSIDGQCATTGATCRDDGTGTAKCLCSSSGQTYHSAADSCTSDCGSLNAVTNGQVTTAGGTTEGQTAVYSCDSGYTLSGVSSRICQSSGTWSGTEPSCIPGCSALNPPLNGNTVNTSEGLAFGNAAYYSCQSGYALVGSASRICQSDSTWSGTDPECKIDCGSLGSPENGLVDLADGTYEGQAASFVCNAGYALLGDPTRTCKSSGLWDGGQPICIFAIVPDAMLIFAVLCIVLALIDIFIFVLFIYFKCCKTDDQSKYDVDEEEPEEKKPTKQHRSRKIKKLPERKEEKATDTMTFSDERLDDHPPPTFKNSDDRRLSFKGRVAKVGPEKTKAAISAIVKNGFLNRQEKGTKADEKKDLSRSLPSLKKEIFQKKPPTGPKQTTKRPPKTPSKDLPKFTNETLPFVPLVTSVAPTTTTGPQTDERKEELMRSGAVTPVEEPTQKEPEKKEAPAEQKRTPSPEVDLVSLGHLTNPVFETDDDEFGFGNPNDPTKPQENPASSLRGRVSMSGVPEQENLEGERLFTDESRRRMKATVNAYKPTLLQNP